MWPMYVDYSDDECRRLLRSLELEAYAAIINAFRAQGCLSKDKRKQLQDLCSTLSISMERHRAEIRRAVNDEHLNTVAERLYGPNTSTEWQIEGRRVVPLMQRLAPQTVFTDIANSAANAQATKNASLPLPGRTGLREMSNGVETMASRKRKDLPTDTYLGSRKIQVIDGQHLTSFSPFDIPGAPNVESPHVPEAPTTENLTGNEAPSQESSSMSDYISSKIPPMAHVPSLVSPVKSASKHMMMKSSTVTTFSSFDQITSNLLSSKPVSRSSLQSISHDLPSVSDVLKPISETKSLQRSSSTGAMRTTVIPNTVPPTSATSSSSDRSSSSSVPSQSKFVSQLRSKPPVTGRQNLPSGLGVKLNIQPQVTPRAMSPKTPGSKPKPDTTSSSGYMKKPSSGGFSATSQPENTSPQFVLNEGLTITKTQSNVQKSSPAKTEPQSAASHQAASKVPVTKSLPKASTSSSQYISRSLFGSGTKGAKTLPPVIFNVSTSSASHQTPTKTTGPTQSEAGKSTTQLLPKSTAIGVSQSHMKLGSSTTQTIQYRNDGGLVRSARIINVTPPAGSRLPCSITPSAISALGLSSNLTSGALRVTLPAGTLNTSSMRATAVAKPNVIVVHKAQMWPRSQGAAVIMSSTPVQRVPGDTSQENPSQKQEKIKPPTVTTSTTAVATTTKPITKPLTTPRPQSPIVSVTCVKAADSNSLRTSSPSAVVLSESPVPKDTSAATNKTPPVSQANTGSTNQVGSTSTNQKLSEDASEASCKKNLLAEVIEASGLLENSNKSSSKEKDISTKKEKETIVKLTQKSISSSLTSDSQLKNTLDSTTSVKAIDNAASNVVASNPDGSKNGQSVQKQDKVETTMVQPSESSVAVPLSETDSKPIPQNQTEDSKDKNT